MKNRWFLMVGILVFLIGSVSFAQTWSEEQKEVWGSVDEMWKAFKDGNIQEVISRIDESYRGWHSGELAPSNKAEIIPWLERFGEKEKMEIYTIHPMSIDIYDDISIVFYTCQMLIVNAEGTESREAQRMMDIYRKNVGKWLLIADYAE